MREWMLVVMLHYAILFLFISLIVIFLYLICLRLWFRRRRKMWKAMHKSCSVTVGFFHPFCNAGGGGERVLWSAIRALQIRYPSIHCVVYTGDIESSAEQILEKCKKQFNINLPNPIEFVFLYRRNLVEAKNYPLFTLLLQSLASSLLGLEALCGFVPDIFIDSMGYAFTFPIFKYLGSCRIACYVHYPTISTDMLVKVSNRDTSHNNREMVSKSVFLTRVKLLYYYIFAYYYGLVGRQADVIMVNSSWTKGHIVSLWNKPNVTFLVFPPCDTSEFNTIPLIPGGDIKRLWRILSIAQFRPEKDHILQIKAFHEFLNRLTATEKKDVILVLVGSCRNNEDQLRVFELQKLCKELDVCENIEFKTNLSFEDLKSEMQKAVVALHTMWNEHFGIGVVECMAAGLITIAHNSGGPKMDIVVDYNGNKTGFLADSVSGYADAMEMVLRMPCDEQECIKKNGRNSVSRFSVDRFEESFLSATQSLFL